MKHLAGKAFFGTVATRMPQSAAGHTVVTIHGSAPPRIRGVSYIAARRSSATCGGLDHVDVDIVEATMEFIDNRWPISLSTCNSSELRLGEEDAALGQRIEVLPTPGAD